MRYFSQDPRVIIEDMGQPFKHQRRAYSALFSEHKSNNVFAD